MINSISYIGNKEILKSHKIAFLCSRKCPASIILKSYDWAIAQREQGNCVVSGFHSKIEQDVFHYLLKGSQPIILIEARYIKKKYKQEINRAIKENRLLIISPFDQSITRISAKTAARRNEFIAELADEIFIAYASPNGTLKKLFFKMTALGKKISTFHVEENKELIEALSN